VLNHDIPPSRLFTPRRLGRRRPRRPDQIPAMVGEAASGLPNRARGSTQRRHFANAATPYLVYPSNFWVRAKDWASTRGGGAMNWRQTRTALAAAIVLAGWALVVPVASAGLVKEAASRVESTVTPGHVPTGATPSLPSTAPPVTPPLPSAPPPPITPPIPQAQPTSPVLPHQPSPPASGDGAPSSAEQVAREVGRSAGSIMSRGGETAQPGSVAGASHDDARELSAPVGALRAGAGRVPPDAPSTPISIAAAEVAALQRWFAHVWPAIALGGAGSVYDWVPAAIGESLLRRALAGIAQSLFAVPSLARAISDSPSVESGSAQDSPLRAFTNAAALVSWKTIVYVFALAALLALLAFTVWREFRSALRPGVR
jgi:hypothetical protein